MRKEIEQSNSSLKVHIETEPNISGDGETVYVCCDGQRIAFRFPEDEKWRGVRQGYQVSGGVDDTHLFADLTVRRVGTA